ncbi:hypothetical protein BV898_12311 [Hypsibius exemplaris]|uniref:Phospholipase A2-like central domain-containing protein n=1 Tax=Hypsibius exemplaris TaxID=2072580 RepID=A0A1W0WE36_HYPEX|nr:hypothetical protein BV898_12311 [Hypsibius exemplaris]
MPSKTMQNHFLPTVTVVFLFASLIGDVTGKVDETVVRTIAISKELTMRQYSDGIDSVVAIFSADDDELLECHVEKANSVFTQVLFSHAVENPNREEQMLVQMDMARLARRCKKMMRDIRRIPEGELSPTEKRTRTRLDLDVLADGTDFCARQVVADGSQQAVVPSNATDQGNSSRTKLEGEGKALKESPLDRCCEAWQSCTPLVHALSSANGLFNPYFWPIRSCECNEKLRTCLAHLAKDGDTNQRKAAAAFSAAFFDEVQPKCFTVGKETKCTDYDLWHTRCLANEEVEVFKII